jgi:hypothetical protein
MPATPSRIGFITQEYRTATAGPNGTVATLYGNAARDTPEPLETFFDDSADAQAMANERLTLLEARRSLVTVSIDRLDEAIALDPSVSLPTVTVIDDEQSRNSAALVVGISLDFAQGRAILETWG